MHFWRVTIRPLRVASGQASGSAGDNVGFYPRLSYKRNDRRGYKTGAYLEGAGNRLRLKKPHALVRLLTSICVPRIRSSTCLASCRL